MENTQILFTLFCTVVFCLGWREVTDEGNLLYFLRKPFEGLYSKIENKEFMITDLKSETNRNYALLSIYSQDLSWLKLIYYFAKPTVLCITCMASVWGCVVFIYFNGISTHLIGYLIFNCISASFIQTFIYKLYNKL